MSENTAIRFKMANGCSSWIRAPTRKNMTVIYKFLIDKSEDRKRKPEFTYGAIAKLTGINPHQVQFACQKMAFKGKNPLIKIFTSTSGKKGNIKLHEKVILIGKLKKSSSGEDG